MDLDKELLDTGKERGIVNISGDESLMVNKLYGPLIFCGLRITARTKDCRWIVEREVIEIDKQGNDKTYYETILELDGQASIDFR